MIDQGCLPSMQYGQTVSDTTCTVTLLEDIRRMRVYSSREVISCLTTTILLQLSQIFCLSELARLNTVPEAVL